MGIRGVGTLTDADTDADINININPNFNTRRSVYGLWIMDYEMEGILGAERREKRDER